MAAINVSPKVWLTAIISMVVLLMAYWYDKSRVDDLLARVELTHQSLLDIEASVSVNPKTKIAIGFGSCVDVITQSRDVILDRYRPPKDPKPHDIIETTDELLEVFTYYFQFGAAAERYIKNSTLFDELVAAANSGQHTKRMIGGNAPIMATRFAKEGVGHVLLAAQVSTQLESQLPTDIVLSAPHLPKDDIHLLLEYPLNEYWSDRYVSPRANRFIVHNDHNNPLLGSLDTFYEKAIEFKPQLVIVSGLQMMDNFPIDFEVRRQRIEILRQSLINLRKNDKSIKIHFEMASFAEEILLKTISDRIFPIVDSIGLNEQEINNLYTLYTYGNLSMVADPYPRVALALDQIRFLYEVLQSENSGRLTRIHVHTLAFQAILTKKGSDWKELMASSAKAALTAHRHTCGSEVIDINKAKLIMDESFSTTRSDKNKRRIGFNVQKPVNCWDEKIFHNRDGFHEVSICVAPVLVCTKVLQTGGGGDNVSAAGIVLQV
ncbi:ADP-dependent glucokinase-like [Oppia nitens]|uniref:ADP-dependent glucokinase-like n=1 Tax=Oppia nitens TaxID=1686743 RepID=UPI0023DBCA7E|nr:ADP-dependent glucokinase-like [Oppia nitens]